MRFIPLVIFLLLIGVVMIGLNLNPRIIPSPLIGKPAPLFSLVQLDKPDTYFSPTDMRGQVWLLNVWASWCGACIQEHPLLNNLLQDQIAIVGLNYKDQTSKALTWLSKYGNPYNASISDPNGKAGLDWGVYGVPETFVIDQNGIIQYKHIGPLNREIINQTLLPLIKNLNTSTVK